MRWVTLRRAAQRRPGCRAGGREVLAERMAGRSQGWGDAEMWVARARPVSFWNLHQRFVGGEPILGGPKKMSWNEVFEYSWQRDGVIRLDGADWWPRRPQAWGSAGQVTAVSNEPFCPKGGGGRLDVMGVCRIDPCDSRWRGSEAGWIYWPSTGWVGNFASSSAAKRLRILSSSARVASLRSRPFSSLKAGARPGRRSITRAR